MSLDARRMKVNVNQPHSLLSTGVLLVQIFRNLTERNKICAGLYVTLPEKNDENVL